jgi:predicted small lipoprotein YifL
MTRSTARPHSIALLLLASLAACGGETPEEAPSTEMAAAPAPAAPAQELDVAEVGFSTPESVLHVEDGDFYLVSNINGAPLDTDGNGFISRLLPDGTVDALKFIDGASDGVTLHAPKGMAVVGGMLYVADIDCLRMFDVESGGAEGEYCVEGASFLNDVTADADGNVYFTDTGLDASFQGTGADAVYMLSGGEVATVAAGAELGNPNGIASMKGGLQVVTFGSGESYFLAPTGSRSEITAIAGSLDGIEPLEDGGYLVSSWETSAVHRVAADGTVTAVVEGVEAPADIGYDRGRSRILIPLFNGNSVLFRALN